MNNDIEIKQVASVGSKGTQIGVQNNHIGLSVSDATHMAVQMFREYYPELKNEILQEIETVVAEKLSKFKPEEIITPSPRIAIPTIQNACITPEKEIRELYEELLANSMNVIMKDNIHPGFIEVIKQLCPDEAKILCYFKQGRFSIIPVINVRQAKKEGGGVYILKNFSDVGEVMNCQRPLSIALYIDNLCRLGLLYNSNGNVTLTNKALYEPLKNHRYVNQIIANTPLKSSEYTEIDFEESIVGITDFGKAFCSRCI